MARAKGEIASLAAIGEHGRMIADWLASEGYAVLSITRAKHFKVSLERDGVQCDVMMSSSPKNPTEAFQCIRQMVRRTFKAAA